MSDLYRWPSAGATDLRDGLTPREVIEALYAPTTLQMVNPAPSANPTFLAVCAHERATDVEETHVMTHINDELAGKTADEAAAYAMDNDLGTVFERAEVIRERRPAKMVTALRIGLDIQAELEAAAATRGIGSSTLMRQIIEEWVVAHRDTPAPDQLGELVRHLDAARQAAASLARDAA